MFKAALLTIASHAQWKQSKCLSAGEWIDKMRYTIQWNINIQL